MKRATCQKIKLMTTVAGVATKKKHARLTLSISVCRKINYTKWNVLYEKGRTIWWNGRRGGERETELMPLDREKKTKWMVRLSTNNFKCNDEEAIQAKHKIESSKTDEYRKHISSSSEVSIYSTVYLTHDTRKSKASKCDDQIASFTWLLVLLHFVLGFIFISLQLMPLVIKQIVHHWTFRYRIDTFVLYLSFVFEILDAFTQTQTHTHQCDHTKALCFAPTRHTSTI